MKLLEFFGQINELRGRIYTRGEGSVLGLFGTARAKVPTHLLVSADGSDLKYTDDIYALKLQPSKLQKEYQELSRINYVGGNLTQEDVERVRIIEALSHLEIDGDMIRDMGNQIPAKIAELKGRPRIYKYLTTDLGLPEQVYLNAFGQPPEMSGDEHVQFHNARLFVPDTMKPINIKAAQQVLEAVYHHLDEAGEIEVFGGDIRFIKLPHNVAGQYSVTNDNIVVNQSMKGADSEAVYTLMHEYGHKKMHTSMEREAVKEIETMYNELIHSGEEYMADIDYAAALHDAMARFEVGQEPHYRGRKKSYARNRDYVITAINPNKASAELAYANNPERVVVEYPLQLLLDPRKWEVEGVDLTPPKPKALHKTKSDNWFPTKYSMTNASEWWAEMYAFYTLGNLSGEPAAWMQNMLHGNTTETVGSNDGEMNSGDGPMPPSQTGDDVRPDWEWTDPYHGSGEENAVMSRTP